jgi:hypothetical protein
MNTLIEYNRVIPRDLFNESKLLKCFGQLALLMHDGVIPGSIVFDGNQPEIGLLLDGSLTLINHKLL